MVRSSEVMIDLDLFKNYMDSYDEAINGLEGNWSGTSYNSLITKFKEFSSEYKDTISSEMEAFANACDLYEEYKITKENLSIAKANYNSASSIGDVSKANSYSSRISEYTTNINNLKSKINSYLEIASVSKLSASSNQSGDIFISQSVISGEDKYINLDGMDSNSRVGKAYEQYKNELNNASYVYVTKDMFAITYNAEVGGKTTEVTHIVINDGSQINGSPANGSYASGLEKTSSAAKRLGAIYAINGSHFNYSDGSQDLRGENHIVISNGEIKTDGNCGENQMILYSDGTLAYGTGKSASELVKNGAKYSFSCHSTPVIVNGNTSTSYRESRAYKRTVIGTTSAGNYYIVTDKSADNVLSDTAEYLKSLGCNNAWSLDQGGSVTLAREGKVINNPSDESGERAIGDVLYFT